MSKNVYQEICEALQPLGYEVVEQGSYAGKRLPSTYITYMKTSDKNVTHTGNKAVGNIDRVQVTLWSTDPAVKQSARETLDGCLLPLGFLRIGGRDLSYSHPSGHYGYTCDYRYLS